MVFGVDVFKRRQIFDADRGFNRARWSPAPRSRTTTGVSAGVSTVFIPVDGSTIAPPIGDCRGGAHTGVVTQPLGIPARTAASPMPMSRWSWGKHRERQSLFIDLDGPLGDGMDVHVDAHLAAYWAVRWFGCGFKL